jgi:hypothetical protein
MSKVEGCKKLKVEGFNQPTSLQPATFQPANLQLSSLPTCQPPHFPSLTDDVRLD